MRVRLLPGTLVLLAAILPSCAPESDPAPPPEPVPEETAAAPVELEACPSGDAAWGAAIREARRSEGLDELLARADRIAAEHPDRWEPLWTGGECLFRTGRAAEAREVLLESQRLAESAGDPAGMTLCLYRLGWIDFRAGEFERSEQHYLGALEAVERTGRNDLKAQVLNGYSGLLMETGRLGEAHLQQERVEQVFRELGMGGYARMASLNRAVILMVLGDGETSRRILESIHEEGASSSDPFLMAETAITLANLHRRMDRPSEALQWYGRVSGSDPELACLASLGKGLIAVRQGDLDAAREHLSRAAETAPPPHALLVEVHRAEVEMLAGSHAGARELLADLIAEAEQTGAGEIAWIAHWVTGRSLLAESKYDAAAASLSNAVAILDGQGSALDPMDEGLRYLRERSDVYSDLAAAWCGRGLDDSTGPRADAVFAAVEKTHARALRHIFTGGGSTGIVRPDRIRRRLRDDELILDYAIGRERGVVLAIRKAGVTARPLPGWNDLGEPLRRYRGAILRPLRSAEARLDPMTDFLRSLHHGRALTRALIDPVGDLVAGAKRIYVVPDRELALLPFSALPVGDDPVRFLGEEVETAVLPLAGAPPPRVPAGRSILLAGDPVVPQGGDLPPLPHAGREIDGIREIWSVKGDRVLRGERFRLPALRERLVPGTGTVHLATHAVASTSDPGRCAVHLSGGDRLGLDEIVSLPLDSALVVLSACSTGEGELVPGEGVIGLGWAFLRAGSHAVGVSLWSVEDDSATELMLAFHTLLQEGVDPVTAMAGARRSVAGQRKHPVFWAPFVLIARPGELPAV